MLWAIEGTLSTELVTEFKRTRRTSDFLPVHCWCFQLNTIPATKTHETARGRLRLPVYCSLANLITQFVILLQKRLDPWTVNVEKSSSLPQKCGFLLPGGSRQLIVTLSQQQRSRQLNPSSSPAQSFSFFFIPPAPLPWADFIPTAITIFPNRVLEWGKKKIKKSEMSLSLRNIKSDAEKKKKVLSSDKSCLSLIFCGTFTFIWLENKKWEEKRNVCLPAKHQRASFIIASTLACWH